MAGLTFREIIAKTPGNRLELAQYVRVTYLKFGKSRALSIPKAICQSFSKDTLGNGKTGLFKYTTMMEFYADNKVKVSCSCADHLYRWEYALTQKHASYLTYSNKKPPNIRNPAKVAACCIAKGTKVLTESGYTPIEEIQVGHKVLTLEGYHEVTAADLTHKNKPVVKLTTRTGRSLSVTKDHLVYVFKKGAYKAEWHQAGCLEEGDCLVTAMPSSKFRLSKNSLDSQAVVLGYVVSEADETGYAPMEPETMRNFCRHFTRAFGQPVQLECPAHNSLMLSQGDKKRFKSLGVVFGSKNQKIPTSLWTSSLNTRWSFIYGMFSGDGWISADGKASTYATSSPVLAQEMQLFLLGVGVHATISTEISGVQGVEMFLVRPTSKSSLILSSILPKLAKYKMSVGKKADSVSMVEDYFPVNRQGLVEYLRKLFIKKMTPVSTDLVGLREYAVSNKIGADKFIGFCRRNYADSLQKIKVPWSCKPTFALPENQAFKATYEAFPSKGKTLFPDIHSAGPCVTKKKFTAYLKDRLNSGIFASIQGHYKRLLAEDVVLEPIIHIETGKSDVYDLTVPGPEHFTANGFVVHNCKHVIALYRDLRAKGLLPTKAMLPDVTVDGKRVKK